MQWGVNECQMSRNPVHCTHCWGEGVHLISNNKENSHLFNNESVLHEIALTLIIAGSERKKRKN